LAEELVEMKKDRGKADVDGSLSVGLLMGSHPID